MNELKEQTDIERRIYGRKQVMLDCDVSFIKCNGNMVTHYDIGKPIS